VATGTGTYNHKHLILCDIPTCFNPYSSSSGGLSNAGIY